MNQPREQSAWLKPALLLTIFICLIYSNTLDSAWQLDDYQNITDNPDIQLTSFDRVSIKTSWYAAPNTDSLRRPVSYFTFALNWYFGQDDVTGYHLVNIAIHILTAFFLFLTILLLFQTPKLKGPDTSAVYFVALLSAVLWAIHPIQIQAVTYIVQRMAALAALFYIMAMFFYLKARLATDKTNTRVFFELCAVAFLLGVGSKSNAMMLPVFLLLLEFVFFRDLGRKQTQKHAAAVVIGAVVVVLAAGVFLFLDGSPARILGGYENRTFTLYQRLLTQPSIVLFYLSQIFYPAASRLSITHDFTVSTSLFTPWYTLPAILLILALIAFALWRIRKNPVLSFAILFFFGNHVVESTIIPLEMVFEHRNYLPSLFLFVPFAIGIQTALDYLRPAQKLAYFFLVLAVCGAMMISGINTYMRNQDWRSVKTLWEDAMEKAPGSSRPLLLLGRLYYEPEGQIEKAITLYKKALDLKGNRKNFDYYSYSYLANIYYSEMKDYKKAAEYAEKALELIPKNVGVNLIFCKSLSKLGRNDEAMAHLDELINKLSDNLQHLYNKGFMLLRMGKPDRAIEFFSQGVEASPEQWKLLQETGLCYTEMNRFNRGYLFLKRARELNDDSTDLLIALADNRTRAGKQKEAVKWMEKYINKTGPESVYTELKKMTQDPLGIPFSHEKTASLMAGQLRARAEKYNQTALRLEDDFVKAK